MPLSHPQGHHILTSVNYLTSGPAIGVPAYHVSASEVEHEDVFALAEGDSFDVVGFGGAHETITFQAADFSNIARATAEEILDVISAKSALVHGHDDNGYLVLHGKHGGSQASLQLIDGVGSPLSKLTFVGDTLSGSDAISMELSLTDDAPAGLENNPYVLFASSTAGSFALGGKTVPIGMDASTLAFLDLALGFSPQVRGFRGRLDANGDAKAQLDPAALSAVYGATLPSEVFFAYAVLSKDLSKVEFVSNAFTVHVK